METSIFKKLSEIQKNLEAPKGQYNAFGKYKYRSCEDILKAVKTLLNGLVLTISDEIKQVGDRIYVEATATLTDGEASIKVSASARESLDRKGMDDAQITGATSSYARKYALNGMFCIDDTKDADASNNKADEGRAEKAAVEHKKEASKPADIKYMKAKFAGVCAMSGQPILAGDDVAYNTKTKKAALVAEYEAHKAGTVVDLEEVKEEDFHDYS